jgi:integrase
MARPPSLKPAYCRDKTSGHAFVRFSGRKHYLGTYGSRKSRDAYDKAIGDWITSGRAPLPGVNPRDAGSEITVSTLINEWLKSARRHYSASAAGPERRRPKGELGNFWTVLSELRRLFGGTPAAKFGPSLLRKLAEEMAVDRQVNDPVTGLPLLRRGQARTVISRHLSRVRTIFRWATEQEPPLVPGETYYRLLACRNIRVGREPKPVTGVPEADVRIVLVKLSRHVAAMVEVELLSGMRPGEVCNMRWCDIDVSRDVWVYKPPHHKTAHRGKSRLITLGPKAQEILAKFLPERIGSDDYIFSPAAAEAERVANRRAARKTPLTPSQIRRAELAAAGSRQRPPGEKYAVAAYRRAVTRATEIAFGMPAEFLPKVKDTPEQKKERSAKRSAWNKEHGFSPNRLRHTAATKYRQLGGLDVTQVMLGHASRRMTEHYAEPDFAAAEKVAREIG